MPCLESQGEIGGEKSGLCLTAASCIFAFTSSAGITDQQRVGNGPQPKQDIAPGKC